MKLKNIKLKQIIYYIVWAFILFYMYAKFAEIDPFSKNSAFYNTRCGANKIKAPENAVKYDGFAQ